MVIWASLMPVILSLLFPGSFCGPECCICLPLFLKNKLGSTSAYIFTYFLSHKLLWCPKCFEHLPNLQNGDLGGTYSCYSKYCMSCVLFL